MGEASSAQASLEIVCARGKILESRTSLLEGTRFGRQSISEIEGSKVEAKAIQYLAHGPSLYLWVRG